MNRFIVFLLLLFQGFVSTGLALPQRLVIALDGIAYRDVKALQEGITYTNVWGVVYRRHAFGTNEGYFPVSRLVSTFPSTSDVAWTDIFGDRPLPGYQRTYYSATANAEMSINGLTSTVEHERQMNWQMENNFVRGMGYIYSVHTFQYEVFELEKNFFNKNNTNLDYYIYFRSSDDAQHMDRDILSLLASLDQQLQVLRARYQAREGHDLQILILSDHGHNHAGRGERVQIKTCLENAGYRVTQSINGPKDVVLPTSGIEDWIEIHNDPAETEKLAETLTNLPGADVLAARLPGQFHRFLVLNAKGERATIEWNPEKKSFRYSTDGGDPLNYVPVVKALAQKKELDAEGYATADDWMKETITNHYPLALQRIARGLTCVTLNPATILVSLDNHYVNAGWLVNEGSMLESCGSTHGALDDINSVGIVLSNFKPVPDTSTDRVAGYFDNFPGLRNYRSEENDAEWVTKKEQATMRIPHDSFDTNYLSLPDDKVFLRVWSPQLTNLDKGVSLEATIEKIPRFTSWQDAAADPPPGGHEWHLSLKQPISVKEKSFYERVYACPPDLALEPLGAYEICGWIQDGNKKTSLFEFTFDTDDNGQPVAY